MSVNKVENSVKKPSQIKSRKRVKEHAEVYTQPREVKNILAMTQAADNIFWRFLEPACGNGNFISEILTQRLEKIGHNANYRPRDKREFAIAKAVSTIYGIDILPDNITECHNRMSKIISDYLPKPSILFSQLIKYILSLNLIVGDTLNGTSHIRIVEWSFLGKEYLSRSSIKQREFIYADLIREGGNAHPVLETRFEPISNHTIIDYRKCICDYDNNDTNVGTKLPIIGLAEGS